MQVRIPNDLMLTIFQQKFPTEFEVVVLTAHNQLLEQKLKEMGADLPEQQEEDKNA